MPALKKPCPRCGNDGDVVVSAPGVAACRVCRGTFVSSKVMVPALIAAGIAPAQLKEIVAKEGRKLRPCPTCDAQLTTFPVRRELVHACSTCNAMWVDDGALLRLGGIDPAKLAPEEPLPTVQGSMLELASEGLPAAGPMKPFIEPKPASMHDDSNPLGMFAPEAKAPVDDTPFVPSVGSFNESSTSRSSFVALGMKLVVAAVFLGGLYYAVNEAFSKGEPTDVGGGYEVLFWDKPVKIDNPAVDFVSGGRAKRFLSPWGTNHLEVIHFPGGGGELGDMGKNGRPEQAVGRFHGSTRMLGPPACSDGVCYTELDFVDESDPFKTNKNVGGVCRYYFDERDGWTVCGYSDSNIFARSGKSMSFVGSFRKKGKAGAGGGGGSVPRSGAAVGVVGGGDD